MSAADEQGDLRTAGPRHRGSPARGHSRLAGLSAAPPHRLGLAYGLAAYLLWGCFPFFFVALAPATPWEILAHRIVWTFLCCLVVLAIRRDLRWVPAMLHRPRMLLGLTVAAVLIAVNWGVYVTAVLAGHTSDAALGYFLNPLVTVALGVLVLREQLRALQWLAVAVAGVAAVFLTVVAGQVPVTALTLACSFALYGLLKNRMGADLPALHGLTVETAVLTPAALAVVAGLVVSGASSVGSSGASHVVLVLLTGPVTMTPLVLFAAAARRIPLVTVGLLQFVAPVLQLLASLALGEQISPARWVGFGIVWVALLVLTVDSVAGRLAARSAAGRELGAGGPSRKPGRHS